MLVVAPTGESLVMEIAATDEEKALGLMWRREIPRGRGMYFPFSEPGYHPFWMLHCLVPLDLVWLDENGVVVHVVDGAAPCPAEPCPSYTPSAPATQVIEVGAGEAHRLGIAPGARLMLQPVGTGERNR